MVQMIASIPWALAVTLAAILMAVLLICVGVASLIINADADRIRRAGGGWSRRRGDSRSKAAPARPRDR